MMLLNDSEIEQMVALGRERDVEVCLFVRPRGGWDIGVQSTSAAGGGAAAVLRGADQLVYGSRTSSGAATSAYAACWWPTSANCRASAGYGSTAHLPPDLEIKASISMPTANPAAAGVLEDLGVITINQPIDLTLARWRRSEARSTRLWTSMWRAPTTSAACSATTRSRPLCARRLPRISSSRYGTRRRCIPRSASCRRGGGDRTRARPAGGDRSFRAPPALSRGQSRPRADDDVGPDIGAAGRTITYKY